MSKLKNLTLLAIAVLLLAVGCANEPGTLVPTVDTDAIVATVAAELQAANEELQTEAAATAPTTTPEPVATDTPAPTPATVNLPEGFDVMAVAEFQAALVDVYRQASPSVVYIIVPPLGSGSGFVFDEEGYIVTNNHVVEGGRSFEVVFATGERLAGELVGTDPDSDLAVLKVEELPASVEPLPLAAGDDLAAGQLVVAIGNPFGEQGSMSLGIISALGRSLPSQRDLGTNNSYSLPEVIQTDAPINPGNSGGPLLNLDGEVVGVNSAIATTTGTNSGVGFSIPVQAVSLIVPSIISEGSYTYTYMGAGFDEEVSLSELSLYGLTQTQGAYVLNVVEGSPAAAAGLVAASPASGRGGDLITAIDGEPIVDFNDLNGYLVFNTTVGQTIELTVLRDGTEITLPLTLGARP